MVDYKLYPTIPSAPPEEDYHMNIIQSKQEGLLKLEERYKKKYKKYINILERLMWLNACDSGISITTGISSVASLATFISLPVSIPLGEASLTGASVSGLTSVSTKKYQNKLLSHNID